jgi:hypothetical protein
MYFVKVFDHIYAAMTPSPAQAFEWAEACASEEDRVPLGLDRQSQAGPKALKGRVQLRVEAWRVGDALR